MNSSSSPPANPGSEILKWIALLCAACLVVVRKQRYRRNLIFALTLLALGMVFIGAIPWGEALIASPVVFLLYWIACFLLVCVIIALAWYDLKQASKEPRTFPDCFVDELQEAEEKARKLAESELAAMRTESDALNNTPSNTQS